MYLSLNWLREYVEIPKNITPQDLADLLSLHVVEIDDVISQREQYKNIIVGKIISIGPHPDADKLQKVTIDAGGDNLEIICGAQNIEVGQLVPVALLGAILPDGMVIKQTKIRGENSYGMLCSQKELKLGEDHSGIFILENNAKVGQQIYELLELDDYILEIDNKSLTNRPDLWGYIGIAREVSIITSGLLKDYNKPAMLVESDSVINVKLENTHDCARYMAVQIADVDIVESPWWLKKRLISSGVRPINNIVDITNYIMLEIGQPMHAFDYNLVKGGADEQVNIVIRNAHADEVIETLDGESRKLDDNDLVIANLNVPVALAGVMGSVSSQITGQTSDIIFESANFNNITVRKTSSKLGLRTESSMRFEKGIDPNLAELALNRAMLLVKELCPNSNIKTKITDVKNFAQDLSVIKFSHNWLKSTIGFEIDKIQVGQILEALGFKVEVNIENEFSIVVPTWRFRDVSIKEDILEEVARIYGYNKIIRKMPNAELSSPIIEPEISLVYTIKKILAGAPGYSEVQNYSFTSFGHLSKCGKDPNEHIKLANPISEDHVYLRQNLIPNNLGNIKNNQASFDEIRIFEIGNVFSTHESDLSKGGESEEKLPYQEKRLSVCFASNNDTGKDFEVLKGVVEYLLVELGCKEVSWQKSTQVPIWCDKEVCANVFCSGIDLGFVAVINLDVEKKLNLKKHIVVCELRIPAVMQLVAGLEKRAYKKQEKYPSAWRDLSFVLNEKISYNEVSNEIKDTDLLIKSLELFDVYSGESLGKNNKSMAFHIRYQADRNLEGDEIDAIQKKIIAKLESRFDAKVRDF
ncbi:phenylalanine--tRNA ligase subunit beta [Patescibacteria group bacterium]|nr:phenylalanine--tRNA ligase subunit beta [Patescibacteria group bacterium]